MEVFDCVDTSRKIDGPSGRFFLRNLKNRIKHKKFGTVSFVNDGNGLHGSQVGVLCGSRCVRTLMFASF